MNRMRLAALAVATLVSFSVTGRADEKDPVPDIADPSADVRCMIVAMNMGKNHDVAVQTAGMMTVFYYLGRLDGRSPKPDLEALLVQESLRLGTMPDLKADAVRCGTEFSQRGRELTEMGQRLIERGKKLELEGRQTKP